MENPPILNPQFSSVPASPATVQFSSVPASLPKRLWRVHSLCRVHQFQLCVESVALSPRSSTVNQSTSTSSRSTHRTQHENRHSPSGHKVFEMDTLKSQGDAAAAAVKPSSPSLEHGSVKFQSSGDADTLIWTQTGYRTRRDIVPVMDTLMWTQTGYRTSWIGQVLYFSVIATAVGFQVLLTLLCLMYYAMSDGILGGEFYFKDQTQSLAVFEVVWSICAVWWLFLKWPSSIYSLFLRRCPLNEAEYVAVFTQKEEGALLTKDNEFLWLVWKVST
eukprot:g17619.t1